MHRTMRTLLTLVTLITLAGGSIQAQDRQLDAGFLVGEPTGLSFKLWDREFSALTDLAGGRWKAASIRKLINAGYSIIDEIGIESDEVDDVYRYINRDYTAFAGAIAWSFFDQSAFQVHIDYLRHWFDFFRVDEGELYLYYGLGARLNVFSDDSRLGVRFPAGLDYLIPETELDVFFEVVPILDLYPAVKPTMNISVGIRFMIGYVRGER
ncbi:hypothetical protein ACFL44_03080 [Gemmatimonadota bacterium]